ncbi:hypothetical protein JCM16303_006911 [Sporobolomyces ruberrimus]
MFPVPVSPFKRSGQDQYAAAVKLMQDRQQVLAEEDDDHLADLKGELARLEKASLGFSPAYLRDLGAVLHQLEQGWERFEHGDEARRSWLAAFKVVSIMARLVAGWPRQTSPTSLLNVFYPTISFLAGLCKFEWVKNVQPQGDASNVFQAQSRQRVARRLVEDRPIQSDGGSSRDTQHFVDLWSSGWRIDQISTTDEVSIAIGRICLAYTLDDAYWNAEEIDVVLNPGKREGDNDPGWSAFDSLKWMTRRMDAKETSEELRARISYRT